MTEATAAGSAPSFLQQALTNVAVGDISQLLTLVGQLLFFPFLFFGGFCRKMVNNELLMLVLLVAVAADQQNLLINK